MKLTVGQLIKILQKANSSDYICIDLESFAVDGGKYESFEQITGYIRIQKECPSYQGELSAKIGQSASCSIGLQTKKQMTEEKLVVLSQSKTIKEIFGEYIDFDFPTLSVSENYFSINTYYCVISEDEINLEKNPYEKGLTNNWLFEGSLKFFYESASHNFKAFHPKYGKVWGHKNIIYADTETAYKQFIKDMSLPIGNLIGNL